MSLPQLGCHSSYEKHHLIAPLPQSVFPGNTKDGHL